MKYLPMQKADEEQFKILAVALSRLRLTPKEQEEMAEMPPASL
jgi:hypothetical protein